MNNERIELLKKAIMDNFEDDAFCTAILQAGNTENMVAVLSGYGIEATADEVAAIVSEGYASMTEMKNRQEGELTDEQLDQVAGGGKWRRIARGVASVVGGAALGFGMGLVCGVCPAFTPAAYTIAHFYAGAATVWTLRG